MADMNDLATFMERIAVPLQDVTSRRAANTADWILRQLVGITPADTGAALSNWKVSLDAPDFVEIPAYFPSPKGKVVKGVWIHLIEPTVTSRNNLPPTIDAGVAVIAQKQPGQTIFITNNVPYIVELNRGTSLQAPIDFVGRAIIAAEEISARATDYSIKNA